MASKDNMRSSFEVRNDADLQAIQTSVAFKNISDAIEQYRRQFGLAFLALIAFSAIHVGLVVIANLYTMETRVSGGVLTSTADPTGKAVATASAVRTFDLNYVMTNMDEASQLRALNNLKSTNFVDREGNYRQYTVTGFQLGGWKRSELKLYTSVGHILNFVRGKGLQVFNENGTTCNCTAERKMLMMEGAQQIPLPPYPPPSLTSLSRSPPPPFPPNYEMETHGLTGDDSWGINLGWLQGNNTEEQAELNTKIAASSENVVYSQKIVATLAEAAGQGSDGGVRGTAASDFFDDNDWATNSDSAESASNKETNYVDEIDTWGMLASSGQEAIITKTIALGKGMTAAVSTQATAGTLTKETLNFKGYAVTHSELEADDFMTAAQTASTDAVFATVSLKGAQEEAEYLEGQNFWDDMYGMYQNMENNENSQNSTVEYACANGLTGCSNNTALQHYYQSEDGAASISYLNSTGSNASLAGISGAQENITNWVDSQVANYGSQEAWGSATLSKVVLKVVEVLEQVDDAYSSYKANGYIAWDETLNLATVIPSSRITGHYGCTGETFAELNVDPNGPMVNVLSACIQSQASYLDVEPYTTGQFFSKSLGYFERFSMYTPPILCTELTGMRPEPSTIRGYRTILSEKSVFTEYVYMLHGWGGDEGFLNLMAITLNYVFDTTNADHHHVGAVDGFVVVAPADGSTPYAAKTWYFNNDFTGFHMDMIVFELKSFITAALGLHVRAQGAYGFSMGGWGCMHISMTYPNEFQAIGAFNAPILPNSCFWTDVCHLECGVDFIMCELMWTTISVGLSPYVIAIANQVMDSDGSYTPVALGNLANIIGNGDSGTNSLLYGGYLSTSVATNTAIFGGQELRCYDGHYIAPNNMVTVAAGNGGTVLLSAGFNALAVTSSNAQVANMRFYGYDMTKNNFNTGSSFTYGICGSGEDSCAMSSVLSWVFEEVAWANAKTTNQYFYLDPITFTQSSQYFNPTHNSVSGVRNNFNNAFNNVALQMPYLRMSKNGSVFLNFPLWFLISCDHNDQMGPSPDTDKFVSLLVMYGNDASNHFHSGFGWVYDKFDSKGHSFSQRDIRLAIQWMSDAFRTFTGLGDLMPVTAGTTDAIAANTWSDKMKTNMATMSFSGTMTPCYLAMEWGGYFGIWSASGQTWVNSGGHFQHEGACDTDIYPTGNTTLAYDRADVYDVPAKSAADMGAYGPVMPNVPTAGPPPKRTGPPPKKGPGLPPKKGPPKGRKLSMVTKTFAHPGPPTGIFPDKIKAARYHVASHAMEGGPTDEAIKHLNDAVVSSGKFAANTATGADDLTADVAVCWSFVGFFNLNGDYVPRSMEVSGTKTILQQSTCCVSGGWACLEVIRETFGWQGTDCCKSSTWTSWMQDSSGDYHSTLFSASVQADLTTLNNEAKTSKEKMYKIMEV